MEAIDTVYEFAGYEAACAIWAALAGLGIPLLVALAGVAWRFMRVAEDGMARPLVVYLVSLIVLWWLMSPTTLRDNVRAPRFAAWLTAATDTFTRSAIRNIDKQFLDKPFEWERIATVCGRADVYEPRLRERLRRFLEGCTTPALAALEADASEEARRNPLRSLTGLPYGRFRMDGTSCEALRERLEQDVTDYVRGSSLHRKVLHAAREYDGKMTEGMYVDQVVFNAWHGAPDFSDMRIARLAIGDTDFNDPRQNTMRWGTGEGRVAEVVTKFGNAAAHVWAFVTQPVASAVEAKQKHYTATTLGPELYGLLTMLLLALFPIPALWALLPGRWTALVHFAKVYISVKLWPVGWALLTYFTSRHPSTEALTFGGMPDAGLRSIHATVAMMYLLIPAVSYLLVALASSAAAMPFREAVPASAGGDPVRAVVNRVC